MDAESPDIFVLFVLPFEYEQQISEWFLEYHLYINAATNYVTRPRLVKGYFTDIG